ncbi:oxidoreductase [Trichoderma cornu-damae]|uniref:Oxidoreductase n=1 Tax=Trichoderma cornu-damae TaxID=654480 RepID=A0A9P8QW40_9HYPO|nr:oxidoreductase [Trichoderma cornu-damae]
MAASFKNVALAGASGHVGKAFLKALLDAGGFNVTVLKRSSSSSAFPDGVKAVDVDFESVDSLAAALAGQDVVVSALGNTALGEEQKKLVDAAVVAGVRRFIPSEYGCDTDNELVAQLRYFAPKVEVQSYLKEKAKSAPLSYTFVYTGPFLDMGLEYQVFFKTSDSKPILYDGGSTVFSTSTIPAAAEAVVAILSKPEEETKNRSIRIQSVAVSQNKLLALVKEIAPQRDWQPEVVKLDDLTRAADERMARGLWDPETFVPQVLRSINDPLYGPEFKVLDNEWLGLKQLTEAEVREILKKYMKD